MSVAEHVEHAAALGRLRLVSRRRVASRIPGRRPGAGTGSSVDFADRRRYSPGDDLRAIDWAVYERLGQLYTRQYRAESDLRVHLLVDRSASMGFGSPAKLDVARRLAAALAHIGWLQHDHVGVAGYSDRLGTALPPRRAPGQLLRIFEALDALDAAGRTDLEAALRAYLDGASSGLAILLGDFLAPYERGIELLLARRFEVALVAILSDEELDPRIGERARLVDAEEPGPALEVGPEALAVYHRNLAARRDGLRRFSRRHGLPLVEARTSEPFVALLHRLLGSGVLEGF